VSTGVNRESARQNTVIGLLEVSTCVCGSTAVIASGKPFNPSTTAIRMSSTPLALNYPFRNTKTVELANQVVSAANFPAPRLPKTIF
jgi:hypothetical protein